MYVFLQGCACQTPTQVSEAKIILLSMVGSRKSTFSAAVCSPSLIKKYFKLQVNKTITSGMALVSSSWFLHSNLLMEAQVAYSNLHNHAGSLPVPKQWLAMHSKVNTLLTQSTPIPPAFRVSSCWGLSQLPQSGRLTLDNMERQTCIHNIVKPVCRCLRGTEKIETLTVYLRCCYY